MIEGRWGVVVKGDLIHVVPGVPIRESLNDYLLGKGVVINTDHITESVCWCDPEEETLESGRVVLIHHELL